MDNKTQILLDKFNNRDRRAFSEVYLLLYDELYYFASNLYRGTEISAGDVIQDIFVKLWETRKQKFVGMINVKAYLFVGIRNSFTTYINHQKHIDKYRGFVELNDDYFISQMAETEIFSYIDEAINLLPDECGKVLMCYLEGLNVKETAVRLKKTESTIYTQRKDAIDILKKKFPTDKMFIIMMLMS